MSYYLLILSLLCGGHDPALNTFLYVMCAYVAE